MKENLKKRIAALTVAAITLSASFAAYAQSPAEILKEKGIIEGYEDGELHLEKTLTRAEFTKMFVDSFLSDTDNEDKKSKTINFSDVSSDYWGKTYIEKAVSEGVISGFDDGTFRPEETGRICNECGGYGNNRRNYGSYR
jgi:hypothetical protein